MKKFICLWVLLFVCCEFYPLKAATYQDMLSRSVTVTSIPKRIICIGPGALRLIVYLEAADLVVGVEDIEKRFSRGHPYRLAHPEFKYLPSIGPGGPQSINSKPDLEAVIKLQPDIIFATYMDPATADKIEKLTGIPVFVLSYGNKATTVLAIEKSLMLAGRVLNKVKRSNSIESYINSLKLDIKARVQSASNTQIPSVYVGGIGFRGSHGIESTELEYIPLQWLGIQNVAIKSAPRLGSHVFLDKESLLSLDPETIFIDGGGLPLIWKDFYKHLNFYCALKAVATSRTFVLLPFNYYSTNLETAIVDAYVIGKVLFPGQFKDINLPEKADQIFTFFVGAPLFSKMVEDYKMPGSVVPFSKFCK